MLPYRRAVVFWPEARSCDLERQLMTCHLYMKLIEAQPSFNQIAEYALIAS